MSTRLLPPAFRIPRSAFCLLLSAFCLLLSACSPTPAPLSTATATPPNLTPETVALDTATPVTPTSTPPPQNTRPQYTLDVQFNYTNKSALVNETIVYTNNSTDTLTSLVLAVEPTCAQSFSLNSLYVDNLPITNYVFDYQNIQAYIRHRLEIPLAQSLPPNGQVTIQIGFGLILPTVADFRDETDLCSQIYGYTAQQVNLVDWYPFIVPYMTGKGWVLHNPWYYGEHLTYEAADFDVSVTFTDGSLPVIAASGEEVSSPTATTRSSSIREATSSPCAARWEFQFQQQYQRLREGDAGRQQHRRRRGYGRGRDGRHLGRCLHPGELRHSGQRFDAVDRWNRSPFDGVREGEWGQV